MSGPIPLGPPQGGDNTMMIVGLLACCCSSSLSGGLGFAFRDRLFGKKTGGGAPAPVPVGGGAVRAPRPAAPRGRAAKRIRIKRKPRRIGRKIGKMFRRRPKRRRAARRIGRGARKAGKLALKYHPANIARRAFNKSRVGKKFNRSRFGKRMNRGIKKAGRGIKKLFRRRRPSRRRRRIGRGIKKMSRRAARRVGRGARKAGKLALKYHPANIARRAFNKSRVGKKFNRSRFGKRMNRGIKKAGRGIKKLFRRRRRCFSPETLIKLQDGNEVAMKDLKLGDVLINGSVVKATMEILNETDPYYKLPGDILVTGSHYVKDGDVFKRVKDLEKAERTDKIEKVVYCLVTSDHKIPVGEYIFWDWEDNLVI
jgi:hypothetical protein